MADYGAIISRGRQGGLRATSVSLGSLARRVTTLEAWKARAERQLEQLDDLKRERLELELAQAYRDLEEARRLTAEGDLEGLAKLFEGRAS